MCEVSIMARVVFCNIGLYSSCDAAKLVGGDDSSMVVIDADRAKLIKKSGLTLKKMKETADKSSEKAMMQMRSLSEKLVKVHGIGRGGKGDMRLGLVAQFFSTDIGEECRFPIEKALLNVSTVKRVTPDIRFHQASNIWAIHQTWRV